MKKLLVFGLILASMMGVKISLAAQLFVATMSGEVQAVLKELNNGVKVDEKHFNGWSALHAAAYWKRADLVELLIMRGAQVDHIALGSNLTALMLGVWQIETDRDPLPTVSLLIQHNADLNIQDYRGDSALKIARKNGYADVVKLLLEHGAKE